MRNIISIIILAFCLLAHTCPLMGNKTTNTTTESNETVDQILVINTYSESTLWSNSFITPLVTLASKDVNLEVNIAHLRMMSLSADKNVQQFKKEVLEELPTRSPALIVFLGGGSFILRDVLNQRWPNIPMVLCSERDYIGPDSLIAHGRPLAPEQRIPLKQIQDSLNMTLMYAPNYMEENLQLIKQMLPRMTKLLYLGDASYICQQNNYDLTEIIRQNYPDMEYEFISAQNISTEKLFSTLYQLDPQTTGVLFSSWFRGTQTEENIVMTTTYHRIITATPVPLFTLRPIGIQDEGGIVGGYTYNEGEFLAKMMSTVQAIRNGKQPRDIPFYTPDNSAPIFNYESLLQRNLNPENCPKNTIFYHAPLTFWQKYEYVIIGIVILFALMLVTFQHHRVRTLEKMKLIQQSELETISKYYSLINNMPILYILGELIKDKAEKVVDVRFTDVNQCFEDRFFQRDKIIGKAASEVFPEFLAQFLYFMNIATKEKRSVTFPFYYKKADTFYDIVVNPNGEHHIDVFCMDSTELHRAQTQLRSINHKLSMALDVANIVPWKWDLRNHTILCDVNKPIELNNIHQENAEEQLSVPDTQYFAKIHKDDLARVKEAYGNLISGRIQKVKEEYRVLNHVDGHKRIDWVEAQAAVESYDEEGEPLTLVGSSLVITERKKMEDDLISAKNRAEESNRLKSAFLANMSHEIRTPLNAIVGFSGILATAEEEEEKQEYVSIIENNNTLLLQLISDILDLSKIEAGTMDFSYTDFELNKVMTELDSSLQLKLSPEKDVTLTFEPQLSKCFIHAERNRISQVVINLVTNAIKFTAEGSIRFGYEVRDKMLYFYVIDTGCGIPKDKQEDIFGRFVKLNTFVQGTGLGLSICRTLVQTMGGEIGVDSTVDKGSTFWFTLPYQPATEAPKQVVKPDPIKIKKQKITILVAEDHESNYHLIESILKKDYTLVHAWNGEEAVSMFKQCDPQLILMDINMPIMNGYEATKEIRKLSTQVPIIAVTAFAFASDEQKIMKNGFDAYMAKPINANQLKGQISSMLKQHIIFM
ncbi:MAG: ATP-binding protein [Bacteroides sp.]|nr:ATP-binding protein [Bacteroides sp.]